jgi:hypothetical protein
MLLGQLPGRMLVFDTRDMACKQLVVHALEYLCRGDLLAIADFGLRTVERLHE